MKAPFPLFKVLNFSPEGTQGIFKEKHLQVFSESCHLPDKVSQMNTIGECRT